MGENPLPAVTGQGRRLRHGAGLAEDAGGPDTPTGVPGVTPANSAAARTVVRGVRLVPAAPLTASSVPSTARNLASVPKDGARKPPGDRTRPVWPVARYRAAAGMCSATRCHPPRVAARRADARSAPPIMAVMSVPSRRPGRRYEPAWAAEPVRGQAPGSVRRKERSSIPDGPEVSLPAQPDALRVLGPWSPSGQAKPQHLGELPAAHGGPRVRPALRSGRSVRPSQPPIMGLRARSGGRTRPRSTAYNPPALPGRAPRQGRTARPACARD